MIYRLFFRPIAEADLESLFDYILSNSGHQRALRYLQEIRAACFSLTTLPDRGSPRHDLGENVRVLSPDRRTAIAYRMNDDVVEIVGVFYGGRDLSRHISFRLEG